MNFKRILSVLFVALMIGTLLASCSAKNDSEGSDYVILEDNFGYEEFAIGFRKEDNEFARKVQSIIDEINTDGTSAEIGGKWFGGDVMLKNNEFPTPLAEGEDGSLQYILDKGTFIMGLDDNFPPMGYRDENTNEIVGFDIDLAKEVCKRLNVELVVQTIEWSAKDLELSGKNIDAIWNGMSVNDERMEKMALSKPYLANAQIILVPGGSDIKTKADLAGKKVGIQAGSSAIDAVNADEIAKSIGELVEYPDNNAAFLDLKAGRIDALVGDKTYIEYIVSHQ